jgi:hypothetical protein
MFYGWWVVSACFLISLYVGGVIVFGFTALFQPIVEEFGWSYAQVSLAASLIGLETGLLAPLLGFLVDRWVREDGYFRSGYHWFRFNFLSERILWVCSTDVLFHSLRHERLQQRRGSASSGQLVSETCVHGGRHYGSGCSWWAYGSGGSGAR